MQAVYLFAALIAARKAGLARSGPAAGSIIASVVTERTNRGIMAPTIPLQMRKLL
jgi:hypothetical protein